MENKQHPEQEEEVILPDPAEAESVSAEQESVPMEEGSVPVEEEILQVEELQFTQLSAEPHPEEPEILPEEEPAPAEPAETAETVREDAAVFEEIPVEESYPVEEEAFTAAPAVPEAPPEETADAGTGTAFMDRIPDVEEDYPEESPAEEEPLPDLMEIVNDPQFAAVEAAPVHEDVNDQEYSDHSATKAQEESSQPFQYWATRKGRPKRKKGEGLFGIPNILVTFVWLGLILAIGVTLGRMLWVCAADVLAFGREDKAVTITVYEADTMEDIVDKLHESGLIRYKSLFNLYASISDAEEDIKPGIYDLNTRYDYHALVNSMSPSSTRSVVELTIPEGYTCRQIFDLLEENRVCTAVDIAAYAADGALSDYWFLTDVERGSEYCLEGYLFPDTYQFYKNSTPREALEKMLDNFDYRVTEELRAQLDTLNENVTNWEFTMNDVVIVASLIEKESAAASESPSIAGVIYNRLYNWDYPALLNIDAAIIYAQGGEADVIDTQLDSPYNTYRYTGLTPTPIANPGLSSIEAALNPESHNYYYYVLNPATGRHQFSTTQAEHDSWINEFYG